MNSASRRAPSFTVTAAGERVMLDEAATARAQFTVTNTSPEARKGRLLARPREPAKPEWLTVVGESVRDFAPDAAQQAVVQLDIPPGSYSFWSGSGLQPGDTYGFRMSGSNADRDARLMGTPSLESASK